MNISHIIESNNAAPEKIHNYWCSFTVEENKDKIKDKSLYEAVYGDGDGVPMNEGEVPVDGETCGDDVQSTVNQQKLDYIVVVDRSGSMEGEKLKMVLATINYLIDQMTDKNRMYIISFDDEIIDETTKFETDKNNLITILHTIHPGCNTNIGDALIRAVEVAKTSDNLVNIMLFTDGNTNHGMRADGIMKYFEKNGKFIDGRIFLNTFGFGVNHDYTLLESLPYFFMGGGGYYYIKDIDSIAEQFGIAYNGLLKLRATEIVATISAENGCRITDTYTKYNTENYKEHKHISFYMGNIYENEKKTVLFRISIDKKMYTDSNHVQKLFTIILKFKKDGHGYYTKYDVHINRLDGLLEDEHMPLELDYQINKFVNAVPMLDKIEEKSEGDILKCISDIKSSRSAALSQHLVEDLQTCIKEKTEARSFKSALNTGRASNMKYTPVNMAKSVQNFKQSVSSLSQHYE
jgi:hypothetical protein